MRQFVTLAHQRLGLGSAGLQGCMRQIEGCQTLAQVCCKGPVWGDAVTALVYTARVLVYP